MKGPFEGVVRMHGDICSDIRFRAYALARLLEAASARMHASGTE